MIFHRRSGTEPDPHLHRKMGLFGLGAALGLMGIGLDSPWLVGAGILILVGGLALRLWGDRRMSRTAGEGADDVEQGDPDGPA